MGVGGRSRRKRCCITETNENVRGQRTQRVRDAAIVGIPSAVVARSRVYAQEEPSPLRAHVHGPLPVRRTVMTVVREKSPVHTIRPTTTTIIIIIIVVIDADHRPTRVITMEKCNLHDDHIAVFISLVGRGHTARDYTRTNP